jgi:hypothetical protein
MTITYTIDCIQDDYHEIAGSFASGCEVTVTVTAECHGFKGESSSLGGCSYKDEAAFKACDYYKGLCQEALESLQEELALATQAEKEVYLELNPIAALAQEFELTVKRSIAGCLELSFGSAHPMYGIQSILLQHDTDIESLLRSLSADDRKSVDDGWDTTVAVKSFC